MKRLDLIYVENKYRLKDDFRVMYKADDGVFDIGMIRGESWRLFMFEMRTRLLYYGLEYISINHL